MEREEPKDNSLQTVAIILMCCGAVKLLHLLGVITVEGESDSRGFNYCHTDCPADTRTIRQETQKPK